MHHSYGSTNWETVGSTPMFRIGCFASVVVQEGRRAELERKQKMKAIPKSIDDNNDSMVCPRGSNRILSRDTLLLFSNTL